MFLVGSCKVGVILSVLRALFCVLCVLSKISVILSLRISFYARVHTCTYIETY